MKKYRPKPIRLDGPVAPKTWVVIDCSNCDRGQERDVSPFGPLTKRCQKCAGFGKLKIDIEKLKEG